MAKPDVLDLPDEEAVRHFRAKRDRQDWDWSFDWRDVSAEEHLTQFTFAKAARLDVLQAVRAEVDRAIAEGLTLRQFTAELKPRLQKLGWWGEREMVDPRTGRARVVQVGPRRLATIFDTNIRMAHARGRWERIQATKEDLPWLRYVATLDSRTRPDHARWHGTVLPVDDPWWSAHYPPNGWRCRCTVQQLSQADLGRRGRAPTARPGGGTREWVNRRTGEVSRVPVGIDPGFERNAGSYAPVPAAAKFLDGKIASAKPPLTTAQAKPLLDDPVAYGAAGRGIREEIGIDARVHPERFRAALLTRLRGERGAGEAVAAVKPATGGEAAQAAASLVRDASRRLPRRWVEGANALPLQARRVGGKGGGYYSYAQLQITLQGKQAGPDVALHEYVHHLQATLPGFQRVFRAEHLRRTTAAGKREPLKPHGHWGRGRKDGYLDELVYMGRDYGKKTQSSFSPQAQDMPDGDAQEVPTVAIQVVLESWHGKELLADLAQRDPGMLDLVLGVLFRFDP